MQWDITCCAHVSHMAGYDAKIGLIDGYRFIDCSPVSAAAALTTSDLDFMACTGLEAKAPMDASWGVARVGMPGATRHDRGALMRWVRELWIDDPMGDTTGVEGPCLAATDCDTVTLRCAIAVEALIVREEGIALAAARTPRSQRDIHGAQRRPGVSACRICPCPPCVSQTWMTLLRLSVVSRAATRY